MKRHYDKPIEDQGKIVTFSGQYSLGKSDLLKQAEPWLYLYSYYMSEDDAKDNENTWCKYRLDASAALITVSGLQEKEKYDGYRSIRC